MLKKNKVLAISGGIDSMVMLDWFCHDKNYINDEIIVAHFDHGTRESAIEDANFVERRCRDYGVKFAKGSGNLGENVSEDDARKARYGFLRKLAGEYNADIYTAHHLNDLRESIIINLLRGTGWRGLAVLNAPDIKRPFLDKASAPEKFRHLVPMTKKMVYIHAANNKIVFREDPTNSSDEYLRNRLRRQLNGTEVDNTFYELWKSQKEICNEVDLLLDQLTPESGSEWNRNWFKELDEPVALEILRTGLMKKNIKVTRPQLSNLLSAIKTYAPGKYFNLPNDVLLKIQKEIFVL